jgi:hypothetical protein
MQVHLQQLNTETSLVSLETATFMQRQVQVHLQLNTETSLVSLDTATYMQRQVQVHLQQLHTEASLDLVAAGTY